MESYFGKLRDKRKHPRLGREDSRRSKQSGGYGRRLKNAVANYLRELRETLHDVHRPG
jgi:hypothetical protein